MPDETDPAPLDTRLAKALSHPLRQRLLIAYTARVASPGELAQELDEPIGDVSYHTKRLLAHGCLELVRTEPGRGGVKHLYRAAVGYELEDEQWGTLPPGMRRSIASPVLAQIVEDALGAAAGGGLESDDVHLSWMPLRLDERGWRELSRLLRDLVDEARRIEAESARRAGGEPDARPSTLTVMHLPSRG
jgi:DNA-binding transcriptional ArsR family regulator